MDGLRQGGDELKLKLFTVEQVADILSLNPNTIRDWARRDKLRSIKLGFNKCAPLRFPDDWLREDLEQFGYTDFRKPSASFSSAEAEREHLEAMESLGLSPQQ